MNAKRLMIHDLPPLVKSDIRDQGDFISKFPFKDSQMARDYCVKNPQYACFGVRWGGEDRYGVRPAGSSQQTSVPLGSLSADYAPARTAAQPKKVKAPGEVRNGVEAPREGTVGAATWRLFDDMWSIRKEPFTKSTMLAEATNRQFNHGNVMTECSRWRKFHGMAWKLA